MNKEKGRIGNAVVLSISSRIDGTRIAPMYVSVENSTQNKESYKVMVHDNNQTQLSFNTTDIWGI